MQQTVERILNGKFDYEKGSLDIQTTRIELALSAGEVATGSFFINGKPGRVTEGRLYTRDERMKLITDSFSGIQSEIGYSFSAKGLEEGDVLQGEIYIISNQGEYYLPYVVTIKHKSIESSLGSIKNLFHFTNLAKSNWEEAVKLFYSDEFVRIFTGNDAQYKKIYEGLSHYYDNEQNVEEFLLAINKKQPVEFIPERQIISLEDPQGITEESVNITRNGWGYTNLHVKSDADFISFEKAEITDNDFLGNYLSFPVRINSEWLHAGANYGKVLFFNDFTSFEVKVVVNIDLCSKPELSRHLEYEHLNLDMMTFYEAFRTRKITVDTWIAETEHIVDRMLQIDDRNLTARLFKAQLMMTEERYNEAKWILDQAENELRAAEEFNTARWAYFLYLTTMHNREEKYIDTITSEIWTLFRNNQTEWRIAWLLLYLSEEFAVSPSKRWLFIEEVIATGCASPMFYVEAVNMLISNPGLLNKLTSFEMKIIRYMANKDLITADLAGQFVYLASKEQKYSASVLKVLCKCFLVNESDETARVICDMLIKGERTDEEAYKWYSYAIEREIRVTRVYEYYMQSLDLKKDYSIPKMVYLYFSYESELDWEHNAYLFSHVLNEKDSMPDIFETYKPMIEQFTIEAIMAGCINKDAAIVYRYALDKLNITDELAERLSKLLFVHRIEINNSNITKVIVYQSRECVETVYPVKSGVAYVPIYNKDFCILFEDGFTNRYVKSFDYDLERLMVPGKLATLILPRVKNNLEFDIYACECISGMVEITDETRERYRKILDAHEIEPEYKCDIRTKLISYYYENDAIRELDEVLADIDPDSMPSKSRVKITKYLILRGMYDKALEWAMTYGIQELEPKDVLNLCSKLIIRNEYAKSEEMDKLASTIFFKGKYDEIIVRYLAKHYEGMTKDLRRIYKASENFDVDIYELSQRILLQILYTGYYISERMDIYKKFIQGGGDVRVQKAFLAQCSFDYFVKEQLMEGFVFEELTKCKLRGEELQTVCKLAYLKYYSESDEIISETIINIIKEYLDELMGQGIYMSFFKNFMENTTAGVNKFSDKTIIEYKTMPGKRVWIHYIIEGDEDVTGEYVTEELPEMFGGVHAKAFILFFGENLLYYITEESEDGEILTESNSIQKSDISRDINDSRFNEVNDIVIAKTLQDYDTVDKLLYDYYEHAYLVKKMFTLE